MRKILFLFWCLGIVLSAQTELWAQIDSYDNYQWRIKQQYLFDTYIPSDPDEAFLELESKSEAKALLKFAAVSEDSIYGRLQLSLGKWITKNWQLHEGSRLSHYFSEAGLTHPEDMAEFLIIGFHRYLNQKDIMTDRLIDRLVQRRKKIYFESQKKVSKDTLLIDTIQRSSPK
ncbi:MAG: hypothetical protein GVX78_01950 [Bacteroidetes bacterium]|jgi:hypothetical protein|nr:hypothetical protein [Bacteroidota bacterium]